MSNTEFESSCIPRTEGKIFLTTKGFKRKENS